jgi:hypothetical protein
MDIKITDGAMNFIANLSASVTVITTGSVYFVAGIMMNRSCGKNPTKEASLPLTRAA